MADPVGIKEIAERLHKSPPTVKRWKGDGLLPAPRWTVSGNPAWDWRDIERWAAKGIPAAGRPPGSGRKRSSN